MERRPISITVIAWILIGLCGISLIASSALLNDPMLNELMAKNPIIPIPIQYAMMYINLLVSIASGIGMLKKQNWARLLYVIWGAIDFLILLFTRSMTMYLIRGILFFVIIVFFLFRPVANQYFSKTQDSL